MPHCSTTQASHRARQPSEESYSSIESLDAAERARSRLASVHARRSVGEHVFAGPATPPSVVLEKDAASHSSLHAASPGARASVARPKLCPTSAPAMLGTRRLWWAGRQRVVSRSHTTSASVEVSGTTPSAVGKACVEAASGSLAGEEKSRASFVREWPQLRRRCCTSDCTNFSGRTL